MSCSSVLYFCACISINGPSYHGYYDIQDVKQWTIWLIFPIVLYNVLSGVFQLLRFYDQIQLCLVTMDTAVQAFSSISYIIK